MSSQGAAASGTPTYNGFALNPASGDAVTIGYAFDKDSVRDASDWIAYKKQQLIRRETTANINQTTWFKAGNNFRIQYLLGKFKCDSCKASSGAVPSS